MNKDSGRDPLKGEGSLFGRGLSTRPFGSSVVLLADLNKALLLLNLLRKFVFFNLNEDSVFFSASSISLEIFSFPAFLKPLDRKEGLLNPDSLDDSVLDFGLLDDEGTECSEDVLFVVKSGLFPLLRKLNLLKSPVASVGLVEGVVCTELETLVCGLVIFPGTYVTPLAVAWVGDFI